MEMNVKDLYSVIVTEDELWIGRDTTHPTDGTPMVQGIMKIIMYHPSRELKRKLLLGEAKRIVELANRSLEEEFHE